jgi:branched-chain amino acid transport system substrate-binding protein
MRGTRSLRAFVAVTVLMVLALTGCGGGSGAGGSSGAGPLKIGISLSLSGDFSDSGKAAQRGYDLWASVVNASGGILGRQVELTIVDDASSPDQVVANYNSLITQKKVDIVFGPFSSLLTVPASRVVNRYGYSFIEPAGGGPSVFEQKLGNLFFVQPAPTTSGGDVFADYILSLPPDQRPRTAGYAKLDDPFAAPIAENIQKRFEAAGIKTVYDQTYPAETADMTPIMSGMSAAHPDVVVGGTQEADAFAQMKAMIQLKFNPKWLFESNGANAPADFPNAVGLANTAGVFSSADWYADSTVPGSAKFIADYIAKYGGTADKIDPTSAEAYSAGMLVEAVAKKTGSVDNATIIKTLHSGTWPTLVGDLSWNEYGAPQGSYLLIQWIDGKPTTVYPPSVAAKAPIAPKPDWAA